MVMSEINMNMNDWADFWRSIGFNVIPMNGKIPVEGYKQFFGKAIPTELHNYWKKLGLFNTGIAIINGRLWNHERRVHLFGHTIDCDSEAGTKLVCNVNGVQLTPEEMTKKGVAAEYHKGTPSRYHFFVFSEQEFPNLSSNKTGVEVKGSDKLTTVTASIHEDGTNRELIGDSLKALENCVIHTEFMYHINDKLKPFGIDFLNGKASNTNGNYNPVSRNKGPIPKGERHNALVRYANSLIARLYKTTNKETIYDYFVAFNNNPKEVEESLPQSELKQIFIDAWNNIEKSTTNNNTNAIEDNYNQKTLSVLEAKRLHADKITVIGTITSVSDMYVLELIDLKKSVEYKNAKSIQLEDTERLDDNDRLDVILYDDMINNVVAGETVKITGSMRIEDKKANGKSKKKYNVLHASSIEYLNRKEILVTDRDIETFQKFVSLPQLLDKVTAMFAPNIIGHDDVKRGLLRSIVGGVDRGKKGGGRIDTLEVGDPGTAKSKLGIEAAEMKPNSRHVSAPHATTKTITAIVEKVNESISLMLGAIPLSKGALCAIDEINSFPIEDQSRLLDVLKEGVINLDKLGRRYVIPAATTIIATANPVGGKWNSPQVATKEEIELKKSLMDRFTQIYTFRDAMDENQTTDFINEMTGIRKRKPHNYNFLRKYLIHANSIRDVKFTKEAERKLDSFWKDAKLKELLSIRMYNGLYKIAEAQTKLQLKNTVDDEIADQVIEDVQLMMIQYNETVGQFIGPHEFTYNTFLEILKKSHAPMTIESICELAVKEPKIGSYLGYVWILRHNRKLRNVVDSLLNLRNVIRVQEKPVVLQFLCDSCDSCDSKKENKIEGNETIVNDILGEGVNTQIETPSHRSHRSHYSSDILETGNNDLK